MAATFYFGYALIALSAALLAQHFRQWRDWKQSPPKSEKTDRYLHLQLERRSVASGLIGVVGAAIALADSVPPTPQAATAYLFGLLIGGTAIFGIAVYDLRATRLQREREVLEMVAQKLREAEPRSARQ